MADKKILDWDSVNSIPEDTDANDILGELLLRLRLLNRIQLGVTLLKEVDDKNLLIRHLKDTEAYINDIDSFAEKARAYIRQKNYI